MLSFLLINSLLIVPIPVKAMIPQMTIQEVLIDGQFNEIKQQVNQNIILDFVYVPQNEDPLFSVLNLQGFFSNSQNDSNNLLQQQINQTIFDAGLIPSELTSFGIDEFLNNDHVLDGVQFSLQTAFVEGNNNHIFQNSEQKISNIIKLDNSNTITNFEHPKAFFEQLLTEQNLDSLQFSLQDIIILGNNNLLLQTVDQTLNYTIITNNNYQQFPENIVNSQDVNIPFFQFNIQEIFMDKNNNIITQNINQFINNINWWELAQEPRNTSNPLTIPSNDPNFEFDIDSFISTIITEATINTTQINRQEIETIGENNTSSQNNSQLLVTSIPEPSSLKMLSLIVIIKFISIVKSFLFMK